MELVLVDWVPHSVRDRRRIGRSLQRAKVYPIHIVNLECERGCIRLIKRSSIPRRRRSPSANRGAPTRIGLPVGLRNSWARQYKPQTCVKAVICGLFSSRVSIQFESNVATRLLAFTQQSAPRSSILRDCSVHAGSFRSPA